jgi:hypothetical protein
LGATATGRTGAARIRRAGLSHGALPSLFGRGWTSTAVSKKIARRDQALLGKVRLDAARQSAAVIRLKKQKTGARSQASPDQLYVRPGMDLLIARLASEFDPLVRCQPRTNAAAEHQGPFILVRQFLFLFLLG